MGEATLPTWDEPRHPCAVLVRHPSDITDTKAEGLCQRIVPARQEEAARTEHRLENSWATTVDDKEHHEHHPLDTALQGLDDRDGPHRRPDRRMRSRGSPEFECRRAGTDQRAPEAVETDQNPGQETDSAYVGPYDEGFREEIFSYTGQEVTPPGEVADMVPCRSSLVLSSPEDPGLNPVLVTARYGFPEAEQGAAVDVNGTVQADFQVPVDQHDVDDETGPYDRHIGRPYLDRAELSTTGPPERRGGRLGPGAARP